MCGFVGFANINNKIKHEKSVLEKMNETLTKRGPDENGYYQDEYISMGHKRLIVIDPKGRKATNDRR